MTGGGHRLIENRQHYHVCNAITMTDDEQRFHPLILGSSTDEKNDAMIS